MLLSAGVHGDEYEPVLAALELGELLPSILVCGDVSIVPIVNESAYRLGSRYGEDKLDLARVCPGNAVGTTTERAAYRISEHIRQADYYVDMHTGGLAYDIAPLAGYLLHPVKEILAKQQQMALAFNLPIVWGTDATANGRTLSVARDANVPAIYVEYGGGSVFQPQVVEKYKAGFLNLLSSLKMINHPVGTLPADGRFWVEDYRRNSGYLQIMMPSPSDGIFLPENNLGSFLKKGDRWGMVVNPLTGQRETVLVEQDGLAFLQRANCKVEKGDALGGILPITKPGKIVIDGQ
ncbi:succinylglutamate desuccinylase [Persicitalea jodogahamensis]|uniref:Succinylglutamate desuccinylase n=1 Tax=Persicitalea jodogahamensis TaxID=402147 RepID=A0A8J3DA35_9BACT|nr:succinylglutamate desuccinylase [Persicitalea jodogahamensis]